MPLAFSLRVLRKGADTIGNAVEELVVFCWKDAAAAREMPSAERRGGEEARRKAVENSLTVWSVVARNRALDCCVCTSIGLLYICSV